MVSTILLKFPRNVETVTTNAESLNVRHALSRVNRPLGATKVTLEIEGLFALPETWKTAIANNDAAEASQNYEIELAGVKISGGKTCPRELSEDEKRAAEAAAAAGKGGKAAPPKGKGVVEEKQPTPEEIAAQEKAQADKEAEEARLLQEWEKLDEETKFYKTHEDNFKEPRVVIENKLALKTLRTLEEKLASMGEPTAEETSDERKDLQVQINAAQTKANTGLSICDKNSYELVEFEEAVLKDGGCWLTLIKTAASAGGAGGAPDKGAKVAKGKAPAPGAASDDLKPIVGRSWVDLSSFKNPGCSQLQQRVFLETVAPPIKETTPEGVEKYVDATEVVPIFEETRSYLKIKLSLSNPVTPVKPAEPEPHPTEIIPMKKLVKWPFSKNPNDDFCKQVAIAVKALTREYYQMFHSELIQQAKVPNSQGETLKQYEDRKKEFFYEINTSGKYHILKEKLKKTIVRLVREHFHRDETTLKGLTRDSRDHFYSELYCYLVQQMKGTVQEMVKNEKDELHLNVTVPVEQGERERDHLIQKQTGETIEQRHKRLAYEEEFLRGDLQEAEKHLQKLQKINEGDPRIMWEISQFFLRQGELSKAEHQMRDCLAFDATNQSVMMAYACLLCQMTRYQEAIVLLKGLLPQVGSSQKESMKEEMENQVSEMSRVYLLISLAYQMACDEEMAEKYKALCYLAKLRELGRITEAGTAQDTPPVSSQLISVPATAGPSAMSAGQGSEEVELSNEVKSTVAYKGLRLTIIEADEVTLDLTKYLLKQKLHNLAEQVLQYVTSQSTFTFLSCEADLAICAKNWPTAIETLTKLTDQDPRYFHGFEQMGHALFKQCQYSSALQRYMKAIRVASLNGQEIKDPLVYQLAGECYLRQGKWEDAKVMFILAAEDYKTSFSYFSLGCATYNLGHLQESERVLGLANSLDCMRPETWGYLALVLLKKQTPEFCAAYQTQNEAFKLGLTDLKVLDELNFLNLSQLQYKAARESLEYSMLVQGGSKNQKRLSNLFKQFANIIGAKLRLETTESLDDQMNQIVRMSLGAQTLEVLSDNMNQYIELMSHELVAGKNDKTYRLELFL